MNIYLDLCELGPSRALRIAREGGIAWHGRDVDRDRVFVGSSFCPTILGLWNETDIADLKDLFKAVTLVLPIASESQFDSTLAHAESLIAHSAGAVDEVTVNDFGMLVYWGQRKGEGLDVAVNLGRLMVKDARDPRSPLHFEAAHVPVLFERDWQGACNFDRLQATCPIKSVELEPGYRALDLTGVPDSCTIAIHGPLCYQSTGHICEFASIGCDAERKFRPNAPCALQCQSSSIRYRTSSGVDFLKIGRAVYFENDAMDIEGSPALRMLYSPLKEVLA